MIKINVLSKDTRDKIAHFNKTGMSQTTMSKQRVGKRSAVNYKVKDIKDHRQYPPAWAPHKISIHSLK